MIPAHSRTIPLKHTPIMYIIAWGAINNETSLFAKGRIPTGPSKHRLRPSRPVGTLEGPCWTWWSSARPAEMPVRHRREAHATHDTHAVTVETRRSPVAIAFNLTKRWTDSVSISLGKQNQSRLCWFFSTLSGQELVFLLTAERAYFLFGFRFSFGASTSC